jgi:hypothetical protein
MLRMFPIAGRTMASVAPTGLPTRTWTVDQVVEWATSVISQEDARFLKDQRICGKSLLKLKTQQLVTAGLKLGPASALVEAIRPSLDGPAQALSAFLRSQRSTLATRCSPYLLAISHPCVALLLSHLFPLRPPTALPPHFPPCAEPKTILIDLSEGKEDPVPFTIESQSELNQLRRDFGAGGFMNGTRRAILKVEDLVDGDAYTMLFNKGSGLTKLQGGMETMQGTLKSLDEAFEEDVSPCPAVFSLSFLSFFLPPPSILSFARSFIHFALHPS